MMPSAASDHTLVLATSFFEHLTDVGPLYILLLLLFGASVVVAVVAIVRRSPLPWMLFFACMPFVWASAATHVAFVSSFMILDATAPPAVQVAPFVRATRVFNWGCFLSLILIVASLLHRPKKIGPSITLPQSPS